MLEHKINKNKFFDFCNGDVKGEDTETLNHFDEHTRYQFTRMLYAYGTGMTGQNPFANDEKVEITADIDSATEVYGHILDEDRKKNAQLMENAFYNKENLNPDIHGASGIQNNNNNNMISVPEGVDADMLMKVLGNPEMAALLTSLAKSMKG